MKYTQKPYLPFWEAIFPLLLLSPFDFPELALGCVETLGLISLITCEQSSLKCMQDETDLTESLEGEEGEISTFPLSCVLWVSILSLFLEWEYCTDECEGEIWKFRLIGGGGADRDKLGQPRCWETVG
jgi:hypothetical protein